MPLTRDEVLELVTVEAAYKKAKAKLDDADAARKKVRGRLLPKLPIDRYVELFGVRLRRRQGSTGDKFSLSDARKAGYKLPKYLERFVSKSRPTELLDLEPAADPAAELELLAEQVRELAAA
jgi:hypothetical protein